MFNLVYNAFQIAVQFIRCYSGATSRSVFFNS